MTACEDQPGGDQGSKERSKEADAPAGGAAERLIGVYDEGRLEFHRPVEYPGDGSVRLADRRSGHGQHNDIRG